MPASNSVRLLVLGHTKFGENSLAVHTLSEAYGRRSFLVRIGPKTRMALFLPLNILEADITENPKSDLWNARGFRPLLPLSGIRDNAGKNVMVLFLSEVLYRTIREGVYEQGLYTWCEQQVRTLDAMEGAWSNFHLRFLLELATRLGFCPGPESLAPVAGSHYAELVRLLEASFSEAMLIPLTGEARSEIAESLIRYLEIHTESTLNVRSLAVLRELYR